MHSNNSGNWQRWRKCSSFIRKQLGQVGKSAEQRDRQTGRRTDWRTDGRTDWQAVLVLAVKWPWTQLKPDARVVISDFVSFTVYGALLASCLCNGRHFAADFDSI